MIQALDEAAAAERAALEAWQQRTASVMARLEAIAAAPGADSGRELGDAESEWRNLAGTSGFEMDQVTVAKFGSLVADARYGNRSPESRGGGTPG